MTTPKHAAPTSGTQPSTDREFWLPAIYRDPPELDPFVLRYWYRNPDALLEVLLGDDASDYRTKRMEEAGMIERMADGYWKLRSLPAP